TPPPAPAACPPAPVAAGDRGADRRVRGPRGRAPVWAADDGPDGGVGRVRRRGDHRARLVGPSAEPGVLGRGADGRRRRLLVPAAALAWPRSPGEPAGPHGGDGAGRRR